MASLYTGTKWGPSGQGLAGGTVSWSFATVAGSLISFDGIISSAPFQDAVRLAFDLWESIANIDFLEMGDSSQSNIRLGWDGIDGVGGTLAQAIWQYSGTQTLHSEIGFDLPEGWTAPANSFGIDFFAVAVHEIGHAIGLSHSDVSGSIMYPYVQGNYAGLSSGDIQAIQQLYGPGSGGGSVFVGTAAAEQLIGGNGNDTIYGGTGSDNLIGGSGGDQIKTTALLNETVTITGGGSVTDPNDGADQITLSGSGRGLIFGNGGADHIVYTGSGAGSIYGGMGSDQIELTNDANNEVFGGTTDGDTIIVTGNGNNLILGGSYVTDAADGADQIRILGNGSNLIYANAGDDTVSIQGQGNDTVYGGLGDDRIDTGAGSDRLIGGPGANVLTGGASADTFVYTPGGRDIITDFSLADGDRLELQGHAYTLTTASDGSAALLFDGGGVIVMHGVTEAGFSTNYLV